MPVDPLAPQPDPAPGEGDVWQEIIESLPPGPLRDLCAARRQQGIDRYGQPLRRGDGRDHLLDAGQEFLDAAVYLAAAWGADDLTGSVARALQMAEGLLLRKTCFLPIRLEEDPRRMSLCGKLVGHEGPCGPWGTE